MKKLVLLMLMGILVVGIGAVVYGTSGSDVTQTDSHTLTTTVEAAYFIGVSGNDTITVSPLTGTTSSVGTTLSVKWNVAGQKVQVKLAASLPAYLSSLGVYLDASPVGVGVATNITEGGALALTTAYQDLITTGVAGEDTGIAVKYAATLTDWTQASGAKTAITIDYTIAAGS